MQSVQLSLQLTIYTINICKRYKSFPRTFLWLNRFLFWTRDKWDIAYCHLPVNHSKHGLWHLMNSARMINSPFSLSLSNHMLSKWLKNLIISFTKIKTDFEMLSINQLMLYFMKRFTTNCFHNWMTELTMNILICVICSGTLQSSIQGTCNWFFYQAVLADI